LLAWYDRHRRDLPWRRRQGDAYAQLLAEFMLQQTQVSTVVDYYERFITRFPTVGDLAGADGDEVLALWSGLGYYSRARHLHEAAKYIVARCGGVVPPLVEELIKLPGVGRYTAGAIASVAYDTRAPVLDGNVTRVLMRWLALEADPKSPAVQSCLWREAESLLPRKRCGDFNQALMELGATLCSRHSPHCLLCPVRACCRAAVARLTNRIPPAAKRARVLPAEMVVVAVSHGGALLFVQRPETGLWAGLWELPSEPVIEGESVETARVRLRRRLSLRGCRWRRAPVAQVMRQLTHRRVTFHVFKASVPAQRRVQHVKSLPGRWVRPSDLNGLGISRACHAVLRQIAWPG
jgi:A/G-specific adenine glycosylase